MTAAPRLSRVMGARLESVERALSRLRCGIALDAADAKVLADEVVILRQAMTAAASQLEASAVGELHKVVARQSAEQLRRLAGGEA